MGFADAAATTFVLDGDLPARIVVSVREPQDSARVHYRALPLDTAPGRPVWRIVTDIMRTRPAAFWPAAYAFVAGDSVVPRRPHTAVDSVAAAALLLRNFPQRDDTWHALAEAMRESDGMAKGLASMVLQDMARRAPRSVDWTPVAPGLHAMLDGTSLFEVPTLVDVLARTGAGPAQARVLLRGGGDILLAYVGSGTSMLSYPAHKLLVQLRGADLGAAPEPWRAWIASL